MTKSILTGLNAIRRLKLFSLIVLLVTRDLLPLIKNILTECFGNRINGPTIFYDAIPVLRINEGVSSYT